MEMTSAVSVSAPPLPTMEQSNEPVSNQSNQTANSLFNSANGIKNNKAQPKDNDTKEQGDDNVQEGMEQPAKPKEPTVQKFKIKVDGKEVELTQQELIQAYNRDYMSSRALSKAKEQEKQYQEHLVQARDMLEALVRDPAEALTQLGIDPVDFSTKLILQRAADAQDPIGAENRRLKQQMAMYEEQVKAKMEAEKQATMNQRVQQYQATFAKDVLGAISESTILPKDNNTERRVMTVLAEMYHPTYVRHYGEPNIKNVVKLVEQEYIDMVKKFTTTTPEEKLIEMLGEDFVKRFRNADVSRYKKNIPQQNQPKPAPKPVAKGKKRISPDDFMDALKQRDKRGW